MRRDLLGAILTVALLVPAGSLAAQQSQNQSSQGQSQSQASAQSNSQDASQSTTITPAAPEDPLAAAARKAREQQKKDQTKPARVFDNDNIPKQGGISSVGNPTSGGSAASANAGSSASSSTAQGAVPSGKDEKGWRDRFAKLRHKLDEDQQELALMQRELGVLDVQYYNDPVQGMQQGLTRSDINEKTDKIEAKKKQIDADEQAISEAEDQLRQAGGDPGWAR
jgi:type II secretory pathway pseudopilin PulG